MDLQVQQSHAVLPQLTASEASRQEFVKSLKFHLATRVSPGNRLALAAKGVDPTSRDDVRRGLEADGYYQFWSALQRHSQEMMWKATQLPVERQLDALVARGQADPGNPGSLTLDPDLPLPRYHAAVDIHCMPGGYHTEVTSDDLASGAVYDRAVYLYAMGRMGPLNADMGESAIAFLRARFPALQPRRILDLGCTVGHSTLPYVDAFPDAEVHGIDVAAPVLRYAHARAGSLGKAVHFSQQNAEATGFPDGHFDLIVSHILVHETSHAAIRRIMRECHRLLRPGGVVLHVETPPFRFLDPYDQFMLDWDTRNNNEPYWTGSHELDPAGVAGECGFDPARSFEAMQRSAFDAAEAQRTHVFQGGDFGGGGAWYAWGAEK
jgi:SAM-dependent methyltransferase